MESVWIFKLGLWFLMNSISKTKQSNLPGTFLKFWLVFFQEVVATVSFHEMSTDRRIFVLSNALMKVSGCVPDIICIAQITWETVYNALPIHYWWLDFFGLEILPQFLAHNVGYNVGRILWLRSRNCFRTALAATWYLNGRLILTVLLSSVFLSAVPA